MEKKQYLTCRHPDKDCVKLLCGHPLPCSYHTVTIDTTVKPPTINIPITSDAIHSRGRLAKMAECFEVNNDK